MIVKNEEHTIARCLDSVKDLVDEIVIIDTGSTDKTKDIVSQFTDRVINFQWIDDFAAARNFAFSQAKMDYIFWLDADDALLDEDRKKFLSLKDTLDPSVDSVTMHYNLAFDENGNVTASLRRNRLVKRQNNFRWIGAVHEYLEVWGNIKHSDVAVTHSRTHNDSDRNLRIYENRLKNGEEFSPRDLFYFANELFEHQKIERAIEFYKRFLNTKKGWVEDNISACDRLADCYNSLEDPENELHYILKSFEYDSPRPDFCCRLGYWFLQENQYHQAIFWYKLSTNFDKPSDNMGMINYPCWTWLPHLQLCVCYDRLGDYMLAYAHNEIARKYLPNDPSILYNKEYLEPLIQQQQLAWQTQEIKAEKFSFKISFLSPAYNSAKWIKTMLDSIPKEYAYEIIVCDDGSTDKTLELLKEYKEGYPQLKILMNEKNMGASYSYNRCIAEATGDYIAIIDSDDKYLPPIKDVLAQVDGEYDIYYYNMEVKGGGGFIKRETDGYNLPGQFKIIRRSFIGDAKFPTDSKIGDYYFNKTLVDKNPRCKYTNLYAYWYNYPREGSEYDLFLKEEGMN
jgi:glycosyltransferase involved in cell wall biosynthesis